MNSFNSRLVLVKYRPYGAKKITKPKELKGIKQMRDGDKPTSFFFIANKGSWKLYQKGNDIWIHASDFYSESLTSFKRRNGIENNTNKTQHDDRKEMGIKDIKKKFAYADNYGCVVLRQEAWLRFENLISDIPTKGSLYMLFEEHIIKEMAKILNVDFYHLYYSDQVLRSIAWFLFNISRK